MLITYAAKKKKLKTKSRQKAIEKTKISYSDLMNFEVILYKATACSNSTLKMPEVYIKKSLK